MNSIAVAKANELQTIKRDGSSGQSAMNTSRKNILEYYLFYSIRYEKMIDATYQRLALFLILSTPVSPFSSYVAMM